MRRKRQFADIGVAAHLTLDVTSHAIPPCISVRVSDAVAVRDGEEFRVR
jgi:hypothetical protein